MLGPVLGVVLALSGALPAEARCVVLLHGLARTSASMMLLEEALTRQGWQVRAPDYASTESPLTALLPTVERAVTACEAAGETPDFITHSMGGILLRAWANEGENAKRIGRAVMLAPPNKGSEIVDQFHRYDWFAAMNGPAGISLGTSPEALPQSLGPVQFDLGVIAGNETLNPLTSWIVAGEDDGKVSVESTKVEGMAAHLTLPVTHTWLMNDPRVIEQSIEFLEKGQFSHSAGWLESLQRLLRD